jgi:glycosyltransferase involved in cell wall biosynthesis
MAAESVHEFYVAIPRGMGDAWDDHVPRRPNLSFVEVPLLGSVVQAMVLRRSTPGFRTLHSVSRRLWPLKGLLESLKSSQVHSLIRQLKPDVTFFPFHLDACWSEQSVITVHDLAEEFGPFRDKRLAKRVSANVRSARAVVTSWPHPHQQLGASFPSVSERLFMIPLPPLITSARLARELPPPPISGRDVIVYAATTARHKNHLRLIQALAEVASRRRVHLVCTGPRVSPWYDEVSALAQELGVSSSVTFTGFLPAEQLASLYEHSSMIVAPTLWEAASGTIFEAFWYGKPVACSDIPPLRQQIEMVGGSARYFNPEDPVDIAAAIFEVLTDPLPYLRGAERAKKYLSALTWERAAGNYLSVFEWVANGAQATVVPIMS